MSQRTKRAFDLIKAATPVAALIVSICSFYLAKQSFDATRLSTIVGERAYIFAGPGGPKGQKEGVIPSEVVITIDNSGKSIGIITKIVFGLCTETTWRTCPRETIDEESVIIPKSVMGEPYRPRYLTRPITGDRPLISFGEISYRDVFGCRYTSGWAHRLTPPTWAAEALQDSYRLDTPTLKDCQ